VILEFMMAQLEFSSRLSIMVASTFSSPLRHHSNLALVHRHKTFPTFTAHCAGMS
jgi:hypothetical protein